MTTPGDRKDATRREISALWVNAQEACFEQALGERSFMFQDHSGVLFLQFCLWIDGGNMIENWLSHITVFAWEGSRGGSNSFACIILTDAGTDAGGGGDQNSTFID